METLFDAWNGNGASLRTPMSRGNIMNPGPTTLSCSILMTPTIVESPVASCAPIPVQVLLLGTDPMENAMRDAVAFFKIGVNPFGHHFAMMRSSDLVRVDEDGQVVEGDRAVNAAARVLNDRASALLGASANQGPVNR